MTPKGIAAMIATQPKTQTGSLGAALQASIAKQGGRK